MRFISNFVDMASMYETIMNFPLFKGIGGAQVSEFLAKTNVQFKNYKDGDIVIEENEDCTHLKFIVAGNVRTYMSNMSLSLTISELRTSGTVLSPEYLFGIETKYPYKAIAVGSVSIMQFRKDEYLKLLQTNTIYMLNYLNYLSWHSQRPIQALRLVNDGSLKEILAQWLLAMTGNESVNIRIIGKIEDVSKATNIDEKKLRESLSELRNKGILDYDNSLIRIHSRRELIDTVIKDFEN